MLLLGSPRLPQNGVFGNYDLPSNSNLPKTRLYGNYQLILSLCPSGERSSVMRMLWCWLCRAEMPMLDDQEFSEIAPLFRAGLESVKDYRAATGVPLKGVPLPERFAAMLVRYQAMTGYRETNPNAVWHHRLSLYGPPCKRCGKPLRTPRAKLCGSCKFPVDEPTV